MFSQYAQATAFFVVLLQSSIQMLQTAAGAVDTSATALTAEAAAKGRTEESDMLISESEELGKEGCLGWAGAALHFKHVGCFNFSETKAKILYFCFDFILAGYMKLKGYQ